MIIALTGFMGSGKSSVGKELSTLLGCHFIDLDDAVEKMDGRTIPEIFAEDGEEMFRQEEAEALKKTLADQDGRDSVIALGGGSVMNAQIRGMLSEAVVIYLRTSLEELEERLKESTGRPMLQKYGIAELLGARIPTYESTADFTVDTDKKNPAETAGEIVYMMSSRS